MNTAPAVEPDLKRSIVEFARRASAEITTFDEELLPKLAARLLPRTTVYVAHTPRATLDDVVRVAAMVESAGLRASPHIVARRIASARALREACAQLSDAGVTQALVVAGDDEHPSGTYRSTIDLLERMLYRLGGTKRREPGHVMETPNQPVGDSLRILQLWQRFFPARPGHWGG